MNLVDSSGWLEYFADGPNAGFFAPAVDDLDHLLVPSISILEVSKRVLQQRTEPDALRAAATMRVGQVVDLDATLALSAARIGLDLHLALADSVILATARAHGATIWTQDRDFKGLEGVKYVAQRSR